jgi:redox-sensing transcriptional repressor
MTSERSLERLILYRSHARDLLADGQSHIFSHQLAQLAHCTASQVRRDLMGFDLEGSPRRGYALADLERQLTATLDAGEREHMALVGVGQIGRALLHYYEDHPGPLGLSVAFDRDSRKTGRELHGCPIHHVDELERVLAARPVQVAILALPEQAAQAMADRLYALGVRSYLDFTPARLRLPPDSFIESIDFTSSLVKLAWLARASHRSRHE